MGIYSQQHAAAASPGYTPLTEQVQEEQIAADASVDTPVVASHLRTANDRPWVWSLTGNLLAVFVAGAIAASKQSTSTNKLSVRSCVACACRRVGRFPRLRMFFREESATPYGQRWRARLRWALARIYGCNSSGCRFGGRSCAGGPRRRRHLRRPFTVWVNI